MQMTSDYNLKFFLRFIYELTIIQRDAISRGLSMDAEFFQLIHLASSNGQTDKTFDEFLQVMDVYAGNHPDLRKIIAFVIEAMRSTSTES